MCRYNKARIYYDDKSAEGDILWDTGVKNSHHSESCGSQRSWRATLQLQPAHNLFYYSLAVTYNSRLTALQIKIGREIGFNFNARLGWDLRSGRCDGLYRLLECAKRRPAEHANPPKLPGVDHLMLLGQKDAPSKSALTDRLRSRDWKLFERDRKTDLWQTSSVLIIFFFKYKPPYNESSYLNIFLIQIICVNTHTKPVCFLVITC